MRKRIISSARQDTTSPEPEWLNIDRLTEVEITSEDSDYPVENALLPGRSPEWRAAAPGEQTIRLLFDHPQQLGRIWLNFTETHIERTQEFVLRWSPDNGQSFREIVRQQRNFNPQGASSETEDLQVELAAVTVLELHIIPDISGGNACASLAKLRLA